MLRLGERIGRGKAVFESLPTGFGRASRCKLIDGVQQAMRTAI